MASVVVANNAASFNSKGKVAFQGSDLVKKTLLVKIKLQNPNYLTRLESRIQDGKRGGGQQCR